MKLVSKMLLFSMLIILLFGCQYDGNSNINFEIEIPTKISPNIPLTIKTNFDYDNVEIIIDGEEAPSSLFLDEEGTSSSPLLGEYGTSSSFLMDEENASSSILIDEGGTPSSSFLMGGERGEGALTENLFLTGGERGEGALYDISDGPHKINIKFLDDKNRIITEYATNITFDSTPPKPSYLNQELSAGNLNLEYKVDEEDFSKVSLYYNETELASSTSLQDIFSIKITKDSGIKNYVLRFKDDVENTYYHTIEIDTNIDKPPVINSDIVSVNLFSEIDMKISDDWDDNFLVLIDDGNEIKYTSELLLKPTTEATMIVFDSNKNKTEKFINFNVDDQIPTPPEITARLISEDMDYISWRYDPNYQNFVVESYDEILGWKKVFELKNTFLENPNYDIIFVRKVTNNGTHGFPSDPVITLSEALVPYASGTINKVDKNLFLPQINTPFVIDTDILIPEGKTFLVESGNEIRLYNGATVVVEGLMFLMPGFDKTHIFGEGEIALNGGTIIAYDTDFENIKFTGKGRLLFLKNSTLDNYSSIDTKSIGRVCLYDSSLSDYVKITNSSGVYIDNTYLKEISLNNVAESLFKNSTIDLFNSSINSRTIMETSTIKLMNIETFSFMNSIDSKIERLNVEEYSIFLQRE
ncbi:hypothetical protein Pmob_1319 [Petrotoga mobilis SJ95]|uniref:Uncharacterized protein n=1 Tax=Petrotoga mobilis (strain DSM 10674 / SJ95) TaxID=403833 RepID=A9BGH4_PETMO|nr:hypothetical protein [Petrotoga mobilis]ABX32024.1 hypothetical protein Pmob_1319 [Petrotoga mobilis SJ95]